MYENIISAEFNMNNNPVYSTGRQTEAQPKAGVPGKDEVRAILICTAESAFDLQDGVMDSDNTSKLLVQLHELEQGVANMPESGLEADNRLLLRRARKAVADLNETIHYEVLQGIDQETEFEELKGVLQAVKNVAVETATALEFLRVSEGRI